MEKTIPGLAQPALYHDQLQRKRDITLEEFKNFGVKEIELFASPPSNFRFRAEFKIWQEGDRASYAMYQPGKYKSPIIIDEFSIGADAICEIMPSLLETINCSSLLRKKLFQIEFLTSLSGEMLATLIYHKPLDAAWVNEANALESKFNCHIIGRSKKQKIVISKDYITERMLVANRTYSYMQVETGFTQPNAYMCEKMLNWAVEKTASIDGDLVELYCGNGNFTLPLSRNFNKVFASEVSKISVKSALENIEQNDIDNIHIARMSSEEVAQALRGERQFKRLKNIALKDYNFSTIFVDPPRAGVDDNTISILKMFPNILYISCNPTTLHRDIGLLGADYTLKTFALFDQFPYTDHRECGVLLSRES